MSGIDCVYGTNSCPVYGTSRKRGCLDVFLPFLCNVALLSDASTVSITPRKEGSDSWYEIPQCTSSSCSSSRSFACSSGLFSAMAACAKSPKHARSRKALGRRGIIYTCRVQIVGTWHSPGRSDCAAVYKDDRDSSKCRLTKRIENERCNGSAKLQLVLVVPEVRKWPTKDP